MIFSGVSPEFLEGLGLGLPVYPRRVVFPVALQQALLGFLLICKSCSAAMTGRSGLG